MINRSTTRSCPITDLLTRSWTSRIELRGVIVLPRYFTFIDAFTFSITWSIENDAGRWRGGKSL